ncbi:hypothetical protein OSB04_002848 [Centaurea solstitialis]|uniref:Reverse transcriptase Ty1/copia-type domain-containing protein n=1 Tax=Centaurea solstitialis TaxID=347529 RepID=A0AA38WMP7_9ASTR|nr:hypothetical protein OSB04_002848 [Centaurea solstitialis]
MANQRERPSSPIDPEADRALIDPTEMVHILQNNEYVILSSVKVQHTIVREILRAHPISYAVTATAEVPAIYLQQFWHTAVLDTRFGVFSIIGRVDQIELVITMEDVRRILRLPAATDGGHQEFDELVSGPILMSEILALGVTEEVKGVSQITTSHLPPIWAQLFNLMNRCLSSKTKGIDKATTSFWHIFHSVAYGRHIDIAAQLWLDITKDLTTRERTRHHSIPWLRFYGLIIRDHMERNLEIPRRSGHSVKQSEKGIFINQGKYVHEMLKKFDLTSCTPMKTPMAPPLSLDKDSKGKPIDVTLYRGMIGSLLYLTASPLISCILHAEPKESHLTAVKRIFRYLKGTPNLGLWYSKDSGFDLTAYSDSDFAGCKIDRKSTTGGCHLLGGKLNSVSTSTAEAEYVAAGICCAQVLWLRNQLQDYDIQLSKIPIYCDNTSAIAIANNPVLHSKTKHIEVRYHFIRDHVMNGDIELHFVPTEYQLADLFTKPLDVTRFNMLISELGMLNPDE